MSIYRIKGTPKDVADVYLQGRDPNAPFVERPSRNHWAKVKDGDAPYYANTPTTYDTKRKVPKLVYDLAKLEFLETIHESASNAVFKVKWEGELRALKVNHLLLSDMQRHQDVRQNLKDKIPSRGGPQGDRFANELKAYNRLLQAGVCDKELVPRPYGWLIITGFDDPCWEPAEDDSGTTVFPASPYDSWLKDFKDEMRSPRALLLEWIDAPRLVAPNMTSDQFHCLFEAWESIHKARILHNDLSPHNTFVRGSKVVIIDFDMASILPADSSVMMVTTTIEVKQALWMLFLVEEYEDKTENGEVVGLADG